MKAELFAGGRPAGLLPSTMDYIRQKGLYLGALRRRLKKNMKPARFAHSLAVAAFAAELAALHGADPAAAALAGLLHDAARDMPPRALRRLALRDRRPVPGLRAVFRNAPVLLHSYAGAALAAGRFGIKDQGVLAAIREHTLGSRRPGLLSKILYVADLASEDRGFPEAARVAAQARRDLDGAYRRANYVKLKYVSRSGGWRHPETEKLWHSLQTRRRN
jgi:predicted HD superfamily hydrolase involved in NAD metabolism